MTRPNHIFKPHLMSVSISSFPTTGPLHMLFPLPLLCLTSSYLFFRSYLNVTSFKKPSLTPHSYVCSFFVTVITIVIAQLFVWLALRHTEIQEDKATDRSRLQVLRKMLT